MSTSLSFFILDLIYLVCIILKFYQILRFFQVQISEINQFFKLFLKPITFECKSLRVFVFYIRLLFCDSKNRKSKAYPNGYLVNNFLII